MAISDAVTRQRSLPPSRYRFPDPRIGAGAYGVVGVGADFEPGTLLAAYGKGIFPWPTPERGIVPWCSPDPRMIYPLDAPPCWSRSLRRSLRKKPFRISVDEAFAGVIEGCGDRDGGTWIIPELRDAFVRLHRMGWAHSLEVWNTDSGALVGGIYGLAIGGAFMAESMFHRETDASKVAFASLAERLFQRGFRIFDGEMPSSHLESLGCVEISRNDFLCELAIAVELDVSFV